MNRLDKTFSQAREAKLRYLDADYKIVQPGDYVRCAVTDQPISLDELKYWSVEHQEAYIDARAAFQRVRKS